MLFLYRYFRTRQNLHRKKGSHLLRAFFVFPTHQTNFSRIFVAEKLSSFADSQKPIAKSKKNG
jgi:hypothetical protein